MTTLGIVGGGQLGRMLAEAAKNIGVSTLVLDPTPNSPAGHVTEQIIGAYTSAAQIKKLSKRVKFITYEIEGANAKVLKELRKSGVSVEPNPETLEVIQDKLNQKQFLLSNELPIPEFSIVKNENDIKRIATYLGYPLVLKARFHGYDGRGNIVIKREKEIKKALLKLKGKELYVEKFIPFVKELAIQVARSKSGKIKMYPLVETIQENNICHIVKYPANVPPKITNQATKIARKIVQLFSGAGVFAIEMFTTSEGVVLVNEIAPRVHNSGHWTIEGAVSSQFENHVRAVCNLPLKSTKPRVKAAVMINILGRRNGQVKPKGFSKILKKKGVHLHLYDKLETRIERKMGHINVVGDSLNTCLKNAVWARGEVSI